MNLQSTEVSNLVSLTRIPGSRKLVPQYTSNKGFAEDLTEGKFSFPVVHGIRSDPSSRHILSTNYQVIRPRNTTLTPSIDVLQKRPTTPTLKKHTINYLRDHTQSFAYTRSVMSTLEKQVYDEIHRLGGNHGLEQIMKALHVSDQ